MKNGLRGESVVAGDIVVPRRHGLGMLLDRKGMGSTMGEALQEPRTATPLAPEATRTHVKFFASFYVCLYANSHVQIVQIDMLSCCI